MKTKKVSMTNMLETATYDRGLRLVSNSSESWRLFRTDDWLNLWHYNTQLLELNTVTGEILPVSPGWSSQTDKQGVNRILGEPYQKIFAPYFEAVESWESFFESQAPKDSPAEKIVAALGGNKVSELLEKVAVQTGVVYLLRELRTYEPIRVEISFVRQALKTGTTEMLPQRFSLADWVKSLCELAYRTNNFEELHLHKNDSARLFSSLKKIYIRAKILGEVEGGES